MANANTAHSKKLRAASAAEWNRRQLEQGLLKQFTVRAAPDVIHRFTAILDTLGGTRPQQLEKLIAACEQAGIGAAAQDRPAE